MKRQLPQSFGMRAALAGIALLGLVGLAISAGAAPLPSDSGARLSLAPATTELAKSKGGKLSPRLAQLSRPALAKSSARVQAEAVGLPFSGAGSLLRKPNGKLLVYVRTNGPVSTAAEAIAGAGATVVDTSTEYGLVTAAVDPSRLQALSALSQVKSAFEALAPIQAGSRPGGSGDPGAPITNTTGCNPNVSEGDISLGASAARSAFGIDGSGVEVGVLSDSYNALDGAAAGVTAGELPGAGNCAGYTTPVDVLADDSSGGDEGRAMLEAVHDLAPGSPLAFATADNGMFSMADNIRALKNAGARVIADDVTYLDEPMFQEGPVGMAIDDVTASGVTYFSSAANENVVDAGGHDIGSYEAPAYRPTTCPTELTSEPYPISWPYLDCHDFDPGPGVDNTAGYTLLPYDGTSHEGLLAMELQWAEPWNGVNTDFDLFLFDADTHQLLAYSDFINPTTDGLQEPFEFLAYQNKTGVTEHVEVVIARYTEPGYPTPGTPRLKTSLFEGGLTDVTSAEYNSSNSTDTFGPTILGHNGGVNTISTAAVNYADLTKPEYYSSHGPVTYYFGAADGTTAASPLSSPLVSSDPDIAAVDCATNSFFGSASAPYHFCGTSQAAPHAAAVAALVLDRFPSLTPAEVAAHLEGTAHTVAAGTQATVGAGLVNADDAAQTLAFLSQPSYSVSEAAGHATVTVERTGDPSGTASVEITTADGTAKAGVDYTSLDHQVVSFANGQTSATVQVDVADNDVVDGSRTLSLALSNASGVVIANPYSATLTITDDDTSFALSAASYSVNEGVGSAQIEIDRSGSTTSAGSVHFATANGSAAAGSDYTAVSQTVSFGVGETSKTVSIPITDDQVYEGSETVSLSLDSPSETSGTASLGSPATATLTITDNDEATIALSASSYTVPENGGSASINVVRSGALGSAFSVTFATSNGTAVAGRDYTAVSQTVSFGVGETSKTVSISVIDNKKVDGKRAVNIAISSPSSGSVLGSPSTAALTIIDNDHPGKIASAKLSKRKFARARAGKVKLTVKLSPPSAKLVSVLSIKSHGKWKTTKTLRKTGFFTHVTKTVKSLFGGKSVKRGSYRVKLSADANSKTLTFKVT
jgi:hypothetical protein